MGSFFNSSICQLFCWICLNGFIVGNTIVMIRIVKIVEVVVPSRLFYACKNCFDRPMSALLRQRTVDLLRFLGGNCAIRGHNHVTFTLRCPLVCHTALHGRERFKGAEL